MIDHPVTTRYEVPEHRRRCGILVEVGRSEVTLAGLLMGALHEGCLFEGAWQQRLAASLALAALCTSAADVAAEATYAIGFLAGDRYHRGEYEP